MTKENNFIKIIEQTTEQISSDNVIEKLTEIVEKETSIDLTEAKQTVNDISDAIDTIADNFQDLQSAKENGKSRTEWLKGKLDETIDKYKIEDTEEFISEVKNSLTESNTKIGVEVFGKEIDISKPLTSSKYDDLNKTAIVNDLQNEIKNNTLLGAIVLENGKIKLDDTHKEIKAVKDYFEAELDSPQDKTFKKAVSTATVIGQKNGLLPKQMADKTPDEVAMIVDKGVTDAKVAYKLGNGELSPLDAVEYTIDRNVVILNSAITTKCTEAGGIIGGRIGGRIGSIFGHTGTVAGTVIGTVIGKVGGYKVGKAVGEGVRKFVNAAKNVCECVRSCVVGACNDVWDTVTGLLGDG